MRLQVLWFAIAIVVAAMLSGCASTSFVTSWKAPDAAPLAFKGKKVAAVVMTENQTSRRAGEDALVREINARGAQGIAMYTILADVGKEHEAAAKAALERAGVAGVVVMRPVSVDKEVIPTTVTYTGGYYGGYWGGYYGYGWGAPYGGAVVSGGGTNTIVSIETLVYSLEQNKLVWAGQSETTNPDGIDQMVSEISDAVVTELQNQGLVGTAQQP